MSFSMGIPSLGGAVVGPATALTAAAPEEEPNPNLLLWSEEMQQAVWAKSDVSVTPDSATHPTGGATADLLTFTAGGSILQTSDTVAASGDPVSLGFAPDAAWTRRSVSGSFDGTTYVLSVETRDPSEAGLSVNLRLLRSGGFLVGGFVDLGEEAPEFECWGWKLETPDLTTYVKREGA